LILSKFHDWYEIVVRHFVLISTFMGQSRKEYNRKYFLAEIAVKTKRPAYQYLEYAWHVRKELMTRSGRSSSSSYGLSIPDEHDGLSPVIRSDSRTGTIESSPLVLLVLLHRHILLTAHGAIQGEIGGNHTSRCLCHAS
jgi:hypothetical protein